MVLVVLRHAESIENAEKYNGFYQPRRPYDGHAAHWLSKHVIGLTPRGFHQALWLGETLADLSGPGLRVFTSSYRRSRDTTALAFPGLGEPRLQVTELLDEQHYGEATYMTKEELFVTFPDGAGDRRVRKHLWVPPGGGESLAEGVSKRVARFLTLARAEVAAGHTVVAVTHHTTILALRSQLEKRTLTDVVGEARRAKTKNAQIMRYELDDQVGGAVLAEVLIPPGL